MKKLFLALALVANPVFAHDWADIDTSTTPAKVKRVIVAEAEVALNRDDGVWVRVPGGQKVGKDWTYDGVKFSSPTYSSAVPVEMR